MSSTELLALSQQSQRQKAKKQIQTQTPKRILKKQFLFFHPQELEDSQIILQPTKFSRYDHARKVEEKEKKVTPGYCVLLATVIQYAKACGMWLYYVMTQVM